MPPVGPSPVPPVSQPQPEPKPQPAPASAPAPAASSMTDDDFADLVDDLQSLVSGKSHGEPQDEFDAQFASLEAELESNSQSQTGFVSVSKSAAWNELEMALQDL